MFTLDLLQINSQKYSILYPYIFLSSHTSIFLEPYFIYMRVLKTVTQTFYPYAKKL